MKPHNEWMMRRERMELSEIIRELRRETGLNRKQFSEHFQIPLRTVEEWEAGRRKPPEYIPRLIKYQILYEQKYEKVKEEAVDET